jgi:hypothetical protein
MSVMPAFDSPRRSHSGRTGSPNHLCASARAVSVCTECLERGRESRLGETQFEGDRGRRHLAQLQVATELSTHTLAQLPVRRHAVHATPTPRGTVPAKMTRHRQA